MKQILLSAFLIVASACSGTPDVTSETGSQGQAVGDRPVVVIETSMGTIKVELYPEKCKISVENFLKYVDDGFYPGTIFHRVVPGFVIQGGGLTADLVEKPTLPEIPNESTTGLSNLRGTLAMARTEVRDSATSQFYINVADNRRLDYSGESEKGWGYTAFGKVIEGMDVVDKIVAIPTGPKGEFEGQVPMTTVVILKVYRQ